MSYFIYRQDKISVSVQIFKSMTWLQLSSPRQVNEPLCLSKHNDVLRFGESPQPCCTLINPFRNNPTLAQHLLVHFLYHRNFYQYCQSFEGNSRSSTKVIERFSWLDDRWMILPLLPFGTQRFFLQFSVPVKTSTTSHLPPLILFWIKTKALPPCMVRCLITMFLSWRSGRAICRTRCTRR